MECWLKLQEYFKLKPENISHQILHSILTLLKTKKKHWIIIFPESKFLSHGEAIESVKNSFSTEGMVCRESEYPSGILKWCSKNQEMTLPKSIGGMKWGYIFESQ